MKPPLLNKENYYIIELNVKLYTQSKTINLTSIDANEGIYFSLSSSEPNSSIIQVTILGEKQQHLW